MLNIAVVATSLLTVAVCGLAAGFVSGRADAHGRYLVSIERAEQGAYAARKLCMPLAGADWERCTAKALADQWRALADADAAHRNTPESYRVQRFVAAGTAFLLQTQQCSALPEPTRATCDKAALAAYRQAVSRVSAPELTEQGCLLTGCPAPARSKSRSVKLRKCKYDQTEWMTNRMETIVAGRFETFEQAETAVRHLVAEGFHREDASAFFVNPPGQHAQFPIGGDQYADADAGAAGSGSIAGAVAGGAAGLAAAITVPGLNVAILLGVIGVGAYTGSLAGTLAKLRCGKIGECAKTDRRTRGQSGAARRRPRRRPRPQRRRRRCGSRDIASRGRR